MGLEDDLARARRLVGGREPKELGDYLLRPLPGRAYLPGTAALDLSKLGSPSPEIELPDHFAFICLSEYLAASARDLFASDAPPGGWKRLCLRQHSRRDLLLHLVALNRLTRKPDQAQSLEDWYLGQLPDRAAVSYRNVKAQSSIPRQFLARQAILLAMRETMLFTEPVITPPEIPPFQAAVMLTHAIADELEEGLLDGPELWKDMPVAILMEVVSNALFNRSDDLVEKLDRHSRTWREAAATSTISGLTTWDRWCSEALASPLMRC